jgi:hypothetical protein
MRIVLFPIWIIRLIFFAISAWMVFFWAKHGQCRLGALVFLGGAFAIFLAGLLSFVRNKVALWYMAFMVVAIPAALIFGIDMMSHHPVSLIEKIVDRALPILLDMIIPCAIAIWLLSNSKVKHYYQRDKKAE